jgi:DNA-directed RNA polymerase specialized sigma24 family protein
MTKDEAVLEAGKHVGFYQMFLGKCVSHGRIRHDEVEDLLQECYLKAANHLHAYDPSRASMGVFLWQLCRTVVNHYRKALDVRRRGAEKYRAMHVEEHARGPSLTNSPLAGFRVYDDEIQLSCRGLTNKQVALSMNTGRCDRSTSMTRHKKLARMKAAA